MSRSSSMVSLLSSPTAYNVPPADTVRMLPAREVWRRSFRGDREGIRVRANFSPLVEFSGAQFPKATPTARAAWMRSQSGRNSADSADDLGERDGHDFWRLERDHRAPFLLQHELQRARTEACGEEPIGAGRYAAALQVSEHHAAHFFVGLAL